jgi:uncharacterized protein YdhG (YjbR/CyaY superfamily)
MGTDNKKPPRKGTSASEQSARKTGTASHAKASTGKKSLSAAKANPEDFDQYLATIPAPAREPLIKLREVIRSVIPRDAAEIISYGIPAFRQKKVLVWYGGFAGHCSLYPTAAVLDEFKDELKAFTTSKGTVQFPLNRPLPTALVKKLVKARLKNLSI